MSSLHSFKIIDQQQFLLKALNWLQKFEVFTVLNSNSYYQNQGNQSRPFYHSYDLIIAAGVNRLVPLGESVFQNLQSFTSENRSWLFGYLGYDLKNEIEELSSGNPDHLGFPGAFFYEPSFLLLIKENVVDICLSAQLPESVLSEINSFEPLITSKYEYKKSDFQARFTKAEYLEIVERIRQHIIEGDVYEMNFCQEFYSDDAEVNPYWLYPQLCQVSPNPFSAFCRIHERYILSSSMERFMKKDGEKLISQPIKGTIRRGNSPEEDRQLALKLQHDEKERAENVMIVDLVRNDLSKSCKVGSVKVEELFGIYPFPNVHQMISTVTGDLRPGIHPVQALRNAFPMGSMTGAPKLMAMQLIEQYERSKRGVFSGAIGYISPTLDFDFNVVIRTLLYNADSRYLSLTVGSAITYDSVPEKEYAECQVKIEGIRKLFEKQ